MKKIVFIVMCAFVFSSCGSAKPCGLATKTKQIKHNNQVTTAPVTIVSEP